jgi:hypothetical protein
MRLREGEHVSSLALTTGGENGEPEVVDATVEPKPEPNPAS